MITAGKEFKNFLWSSFFIIMQNVNMATSGKCNSMLNPIMFMTSPFLASITQAPHCGATVCRTHLLGRHMKPSESRIRVQPSVTFPIGDHVNILHDYKKMRPSKILKLLTCCCHHLIDMLVKFSQNLIFLTLLKCLNVPSPSMFTNFCINYYAHPPCGEKIAKYRSAY